MAGVLKRYVELSEKAGEDLDTELIGPLLEMLKELRSDDDGGEE